MYLGMFGSLSWHSLRTFLTQSYDYSASSLIALSPCKALCTSSSCFLHCLSSFLHLRTSAHTTLFPTFPQSLHSPPPFSDCSRDFHPAAKVPLQQRVPVWISVLRSGGHHRSPISDAGSCGRNRRLRRLPSAGDKSLCVLPIWADQTFPRGQEAFP